MRFSIRTLLVATVLAAFLTIPVYQKSKKLYHQWTNTEAPEPTMTVVAVPDGGTLIMSGRVIEILPNGQRRVNGKIFPAPRKLTAFEEQALWVWDSLQR